MCRHQARPAQFVEEGFFFLLCCFGFFLKNQVLINVCIYFWIPTSILILWSEITGETPLNRTQILKIAFYQSSHTNLVYYFFLGHLNIFP